jgi:integrase
MAPRKRTAGSGTVIRRPNGRHTAQVTDPHTGRRRSIGTRDTRREAERLLADHVVSPPGAAEDAPFGEYLASWAADHAAFVGPVQADRVTKDVARYVNARDEEDGRRFPIADVALGELNPSHFRRHYKALLDHGGRITPEHPKGRPLGDSSVFGVDKTLRTAIITALDDVDLATDPMPKHRVKVARRERPWTNAANVQRLLALTRLRDPDLEVAVRLGALYGFRRGELAGLRWSDVEPGVVRIQVTRIVADGSAIYGAGKTIGSAATITTDEATDSALAAHRQRRADLIADRVPGNEHVYVKPTGEPLYPDTLTERFGRVVAAFNITYPDTPLPPGFTLHSLRHSFASNMIAAGESTLVVAAAGRWESAAMVQRVYGHLAPSTVADAVARLAAAVDVPGARDLTVGETSHTGRVEPGSP